MAALFISVLPYYFLWLICNRPIVPLFSVFFCKRCLTDLLVWWRWW